MKRIFFLIVLACCLTAVKAQDRYGVAYSRSAVWNEYTRTWDWAPWNVSELTVTIQGDIIMFDNKAKSTYVTRPEKKYTQDDSAISQYLATDEDHVRCTIMLSQNKQTGYGYITVIYSDMAFQYELHYND